MPGRSKEALERGLVSATWRKKLSDTHRQVFLSTFCTSTVGLVEGRPPYCPVDILGISWQPFLCLVLASWKINYSGKSYESETQVSALSIQNGPRCTIWSWPTGNLPQPQAGCVYFWLRPSLLHIHLQNNPVLPPVLPAGHRELTLRPQMQPEAGTWGRRKTQHHESEHLLSHSCMPPGSVQARSVCTGDGQASCDKILPTVGWQWEVEALGDRWGHEMEPSGWG